MSKRVLVTGASGYIGSATLQALDSYSDLEIHSVSRRKPAHFPAGVVWTSLFSVSLAGISTYCVENLFQRHDAARRAWVLSYLTKDPGWNKRPIKIDILNGWEDIARIAAVKRNNTTD